MMENVLFAFNSIVDDATLADGSYSVTRDNVKDARLGKVAVTSNCKRSSTRLRGACAANYAVRAFSLTRHKLSADARVRLRAGRSSLDLLFDSEDSDIHDSRLTKSGGTNGTRVNARGFIVPVTTESLILRSAEFDNASWTKTNTTISANATEAPDASATTTAERIISSSTDGEHSVSQAITTVTGQGYTFSVHVRGGNTEAGGYEWVILDADGIGKAWFNVTTGEFGSTSGTLLDWHARLTGSATSTAEYGVWYRPQITFTATGTSTTLKLHVVNADGVSSYAGSASRGVYAWGAQVQTGGDATDYVATTTATASATVSGRIDHDPINLASGVATQTLSNVAAGRYALTTSAGCTVVASGDVLESSITASRGRTATVVVESTGSVTLTVTGTPTDLHFRECLGLLVEEARTNLWTYSQQADHANWSKTALLTVTPNTTIAPDGTPTADTLTAGGANENLLQSLSVTAGTTYTWSRFFKKQAGTIQFHNWQTGVNPNELHQVNLDLTTGALSYGTQAYAANAEVVDWDSLWWRVIFSAEVVNGHTGVDYYIVLPTNGMSCVVWQQQFEAGSSATSCIPTTSAAVTRARDVFTASVTDYNPNGSTLHVERVPLVTSLDNHYPLIQIDDGSDNNRILTATNGSAGNAYAHGVVGGVATTVIYSNVPATGVPYKEAFAHGGGQLAYSMDGALGTATGTVTPMLTTLRVGDFAAAANVVPDCHIKRITYYPERLTNAELVTITTSGPDALGFNSGWFDALQMTFHRDVAADWGTTYSVLKTFTETEVGYFTLEIDDPGNTNGQISMGRVFLATGFQPGFTYSVGAKDGWQDMSTRMESTSGRVIGYERRRRRVASLTLPYLSLEEGDEVHEFLYDVGTLGEVLFLPDPGDMALSQRYGGLFLLERLMPMDYPDYQVRTIPIELVEKL